MQAFLKQPLPACSRGTFPKFLSTSASTVERRWDTCSLRSRAGRLCAATSFQELDCEWPTVLGDSFVLLLRTNGVSCLPSQHPLAHPRLHPRLHPRHLPPPVLQPPFACLSTSPFNTCLDGSPELYSASSVSCPLSCPALHFTFTLHRLAHPAHARHTPCSRDHIEG